MANPITYLTKKMWEFSEGNRKNVVIYFILFIFADLLLLLEPLVIAKLLDYIQIHGVSLETLPNLLLIISFQLIIIGAVWLFHGPARVIERDNAFIVRANYKKFMIDGIMSLPSSWHADHHSGDTIDKVEKSSSGLYEYSDGIYEVIESIIRFVGSYIALTIFNVHSSYIVLIMVLITLTIVFKFDKKLSQKYKTLYTQENKISAKVFDTISNITTVIILRIEKIMSASIFKQIMKPYNINSKTNKVNETKWALVSICGALMLVLVIGSYLVDSALFGTVVTAGSIYALYGYVQKITNLFFKFAYKYGRIVRMKTSVENAENITNEFSKQKKYKQITLNNWNKIEIKNLNFSYEDSKSLDLNNINFEINSGEKIAFIGTSGSGKTTTLKIIRNMYQADSIELYLDGKLIKNGFNELNKNIALVPQDPEIFSTTIKENITLGIQHKSNYIKHYTDMAMFTSVIKKLPNKIESNIFEKGVNLSGGEKQRLALSRGLLASHDKEIILLDEPTSSVDLKNEYKIYKNIFKNFKGKTIISSIHRLHLLNLFDKIILFEKGKIIEQGSFKDLMNKSKKFKKLYNEFQEDQNK